MPTVTRIPAKAYKLLSKLNDLSIYKGNGLYYTLQPTDSLTMVVLVLTDGKNYKPISAPVTKAQVSSYLLSLLRLALAEGVLKNELDIDKVN